MKRVLAFLLLATTALAGFDEALFLRAIMIVEGSNGKTGRFGEVGPYQLAPSTVRDNGIDQAANVEYLRRLYAQHGIDWNPFNASLGWNAGPTAVLAGKAPVRAYDYANRVVNVMEILAQSSSTGSSESSPSLRSTALRSP